MIEVFSNTRSDSCKLKRRKTQPKSKSTRKRKILMRRRTKLRTKPTSQKIVDMLVDIESLLLKSYNKERVENEK